MTDSTVRPASFFTSAAAWRDWLQEHHGAESELWVGFSKRHTAQPSMTWAESVDEALCFGWIDGVRQRIDDDRYRIRFTPRRPGGIWSVVNQRRIAELIEAGLVAPAGLAAWERRRADRQGVYAYENAALELSPHYEAMLRADPAAAAFFDSRPAGYRTIAIRWVMTAKREDTRDRRMAQLVQDSAAGRLIPSQRW
jgi:uncharacterized protein YdeI (YjbR/CyaY-like superfamily)